MRRVGAVIVAAWACGEPPAGRAVDGGVDGVIDGAPLCAELPDPHPPWLESYTRDVVARLAGELEIRAGVTLADRATVDDRAEARDFLVARLAELGLSTSVDDYGTGANVVGELAATRASSRYLVLGAHFDTVAAAPGADDNASGVAVVLAAARYLASLSCRTVNLYVVLFDQEEVGLLGSRNFASVLVASGQDVLEVHTIDQLGWDADGDRAIELELPAAGLVARYQVGADVLGIPLHPTVTTSSDHQAFRLVGFAAVGVTEEYVGGDTTPYYHTPADGFATVDLPYLASSATLVDLTLGRRLSEIAVATTAPAALGLDQLVALRRGLPAVGPLPGWSARAPRGSIGAAR